MLLGLGDDTAVLQPSPGSRLLATCDMLVEGLHFRRESSSLEDIGRKAMAVNLSDIAAMGGQPRFALVSLGLPRGFSPDELALLYQGLSSAAREHETAIIGGNLTRTDSGLLLDVTLLGEVAPGAALRRDGASPGDLLLVSGSLGRAAAGLALLERGLGERFPELVSAQRSPRPRVALGRLLAGTGRVRAAMDLSDGLAMDLPRLLQASGGLGAEIDAGSLPLSAELITAAEALGSADPEATALAWALGGGEDYELLLAAPETTSDELGSLARSVGGSLNPIGRILGPGEGISLRGPGEKARPLGAGGWDPFPACDPGR